MIVADFHVHSTFSVDGMSTMEQHCMLSDILLTIIKKDIALEVNTSSVNENCVEPLPSFSVIERYQNMGGKKIILGSDAHDCKNLGNAFEETMKRLPRGLNPGYIKGRKFMSL